MENPTPLTLKPQNKIIRSEVCALYEGGYYRESAKCSCAWCIAENEIEARTIERQRNYPEELLFSWGVPKKYLSSSFDTYVGGEEVKKFIISSCKNNQDFLLSGKTGCGKTHLAVSTLRRKIEHSQKLFTKYDFPAALFITVPELLFEMRQSYNSKEVSEQEIVDKYSFVSLLILDDLGAEKTTEWAESALYLIIDRRNRDEMWTIVTSNLTLAEIEHSLGARIASRLSDMKVVNIKLPDYRKKRT
jgi:DNA replication protein DnaC